MRFEDYWENYGELHASMCGGDIKQFAKEIWMSAKGNTEELKEAAIALVQRLELDKDVKKNNWWLNERAKIMELIDDNEENPMEKELKKINTELLEMLKSAVARIEVANGEGDPILSAWVPDAKQAIAKAEGRA